MQSVQRGDVFEANLNPSKGSEQGGKRPVIVVSRDAINKSSPVIVVIPCTDAANKSRVYPSHVRLAVGAGGLTLESIAICEQVRAISKDRIETHLGTLSRADLARIEAALKITLDLP